MLGNHADARKHQGKIYAHEDDLVDFIKLKPGQQVLFHVYADADGLGAEEVMAQ